MSARLEAVDAYIAGAKPFAQPILRHLRDAVHGAVPEVDEQMKWSRPFFVYRGVILGNMGAFKEHCWFGLWGGEMAATLRAGGVATGEGVGSFGRIRSVENLPAAPELERYLRHAADLIGSGERTKSIQRVAKPARVAGPMPAALSAALEADAAAAERFSKLSPGCRREYAEWIGEAKRDETRAKRVAATLAMIAEGKGLNAKYAARG